MCTYYQINLIMDEKNIWISVPLIDRESEEINSKQTCNLKNNANGTLISFENDFSKMNEQKLENASKNVNENV